MPLSKTLTMNLDVPETWLVEPTIAMYVLLHNQFFKFNMCACEHLYLEYYDNKLYNSLHIYILVCSLLFCSHDLDNILLENLGDVSTLQAVFELEALLLTGMHLLPNLHCFLLWGCAN